MSTTTIIRKEISGFVVEAVVGGEWVQLFSTHSEKLAQQGVKFCMNKKKRYRPAMVKVDYIIRTVTMEVPAGLN